MPRLRIAAAALVLAAPVTALALTLPAAADAAAADDNAAQAEPLAPIDRQLRQAIDDGRLAEPGLLARVHERCAGLKLNLLTMHQVTAEANDQAPDPELMSLQPMMRDMVRRAIVLRTAESEDPEGARADVDAAVRRFALYYGGEPLQTPDGEAALPEDPRDLMQEDLNACFALNRRLSNALDE